MDQTKTVDISVNRTPLTSTVSPIPQTLKYTLLDPKQDHYKKISANFRRRCFLSLEE